MQPESALRCLVPFIEIFLKTWCKNNFLKICRGMKRPSALFNEGTAGSRKLLIAVCNIEYVISDSLPALCRRLAENGVKYGDVIFEVSFR